MDQNCRITICTIKKRENIYEKQDDCKMLIALSGLYKRSIGSVYCKLPWKVLIISKLMSLNIDTVFFYLGSWSPMFFLVTAKYCFWRCLLSSWPFVHTRTSRTMMTNHGKKWIPRMSSIDSKGDRKPLVGQLQCCALILILSVSYMDDMNAGDGLEPTFHIRCTVLFQFATVCGIKLTFLSGVWYIVIFLWKSSYEGLMC